jgi:L-threonylcarbamoyladenylate synthase
MQKSIELQRCVEILRSGGLIVAPSDTVYGLVCDATNDEAVRKLIAVKNRPFGKPISVFTNSIQMIESLTEVGDHSSVLQSLLPGPFTVVLPSKHAVSPLLESERGTLGVRLPQFPLITELVTLFGKPLTATSANISGKHPHYEPEGFMNELSATKRTLIDYVLTSGKLPHNKPSTIVDLSGTTPKLLRRGDVIPLASSTYQTTTESETRKVARYLAKKYIDRTDNKPLIFILQGDMGAGKTVFAKGIGDALGVTDVISPTYVIYYEYPTHHKNRPLFIHADLFNVEENAEFSHLGLDAYFKRPNVVCIEWGNKAGALFEDMKKQGKVIDIEIAYTGEKERSLTVNEL